jgi:hypothetical protein
VLWLQREHRNDPSRLPVMALKVVPSMQYGHRMTVGILKRLGFGRLAALLKCKLGSVALVVHGVSLFINLAIFQLAGLATNPALRLGSGRHHLANLHGKRDGDYHRRQRLTVRRPTMSPGEKLERHRDREKSHRYWVFWLLSERPARLLSSRTLRPEWTLVCYQEVPVNYCKCRSTNPDYCT